MSIMLQATNLPISAASSGHGRVKIPRSPRRKHQPSCRSKARRNPHHKFSITRTAKCRKGLAFLPLSCINSRGTNWASRDAQPPPNVTQAPTHTTGLATAEQTTVLHAPATSTFPPLAPQPPVLKLLPPSRLCSFEVWHTHIWSKSALGNRTCRIATVIPVYN